MTLAGADAGGAPGFERAPETARGRAMYHELLAVHRWIRRDLAAVRELAAQAADGLPAAGLRERLEGLRSDSILWQLKLGCLRHCRFVHLHHRAEDGDFFNALRAANPAIGPVVDRLQAEHRRVSVDLDAVEEAAEALGRDAGQAARRAVIEALAALERNLLAHLDYEEASVEATVRRLGDPWATAETPRR